MPRLLNFFDGATQRMDRIRPEVVGALDSFPHFPLTWRRGFFTTQRSIIEPVHRSCVQDISHDYIIRVTVTFGYVHGASVQAARNRDRQF